MAVQFPKPHPPTSPKLAGSGKIPQNSSSSASVTTAAYRSLSSAKPLPLLRPRSSSSVTTASTRKLFYECACRNMEIDWFKSFDPKNSVFVFNCLNNVRVKSFIEKNQLKLQVATVGSFSYEYEPGMLVCFGNVTISQNERPTRFNKPVVEFFLFNPKKHAAFHLWGYPDGLESPGPLSNNSLDFPLPNCENLHAHTRVYGDGMLIAFDLTYLANVIDAIFPRHVAKYLEITNTRSLCLFWAEGKYRVIHLYEPIKFDETIAIMRVVNCASLWNLFSPQNRANFLHNDPNPPQYVATPNVSLILGKKQATIRDSETGLKICSFPRCDEPTTSLRDIVSGRRYIEACTSTHLFKGGLFQINPTSVLKVLYNERKKTVEVGYLDACTTELLGGNNLQGRFDRFNCLTTLTLPSNSLSLKTIHLQGNAPYAETSNGTKLPLSRMLWTPYPSYFDLYKRMQDILTPLFPPQSIRDIINLF